MDISIIIPCYNLEHYIERCLNSILSQNYERNLFEIIVIIDSCTDNTEKIARGILAGRSQDKFITVEHNRAGLSRNCGLEVATGKYVWFIDGDDYLIDVNAFSELIGKMQNVSSTVAYLKNFVSERPISENWAALRFFYERSFIGDTRFSDKVIDEDIEFFGFISRKKDFRIIKVEKPLYHHTFPREGSLVTEKNKSLFRLDLN